MFPLRTAVWGGVSQAGVWGWMLSRKESKALLIQWELKYWNTSDPSWGRRKSRGMLECGCAGAHIGSVQDSEGVDVCRAVDQSNELHWRAREWIHLEAKPKVHHQIPVYGIHCSSSVTSLQIALKVRCTNVTSWYITHKTGSVCVLGIGWRFFSFLCSKEKRYHK